MADIFEDGQQSSASTLTTAMQVMVTTGQQVVDTMEELRTSSLLQVQRDLTRLKGFSTQALRAPQPKVAAYFLVSDFEDTDQTRTNATVRVDSASVTLRERKNPGNVIAQSTTFSSNSGTVLQFGPYYQVTANVPPVGTFQIQLEEPADISFLIIDFAPTPSTPNITVQVSQNGITYNDATQITTSGYRASVWVTPQEVLYVRITFSPTHPDTLGGDTYTFGINDFYAYQVEFQLQSDWFSRAIAITPTAASWLFKAPSAEGLLYFLSLDGGITWQEVSPGQKIPVPGAIHVGVVANLPATWASAPNEQGILDQILPAGYIPSTLQLTNSSGETVPIAPGLELGAAGLTNQYVVPQSGNLYIQPVSTSIYGSIYQLSYVYIPPVETSVGPETLLVQAILHVQLDTEDKASTPVFTGATLENI